MCVCVCVRVCVCVGVCAKTTSYNVGSVLFFYLCGFCKSFFNFYVVYYQKLGPTTCLGKC